ncbi:MAG: N-acetylornithine carbamoyltransferase [Proteobacteria bacterium]|nr:MAG: N-acetylornithine carbamoyltransferase [Pseudomonadota bacterium]
MKQFLSALDVDNVPKLVEEALALKADPWAFETLGKRKTLGLVFFNPSLRTRLSTQKAAQQLGMNILTINIGQEGWALEMEDGAMMNGGKTEHIKEASGVLAQYCDIIGVRCFPELKDRNYDYEETVLRKIIQYSGRPVISLESATLHPLQSLADVMTIKEQSRVAKPKVVLSWAPHFKALPQAVANSFSQWMQYIDCDFTITHPEGYDLNPEFAGKAKVTHDQREAFEGADFVYVKNWSSYEQYGQILNEDPSWRITAEKMALTATGNFMHCLPVRRNFKVEDAVLDGPGSLVLQQAHNRVYSAQAVLKRILETTHG